jgi:N-acetylmuramoyl-L-alanine amidase
MMENIRKEERFMSIINSFLQKRKMHENHHGIFMVAIAYILSFVMLVLGSDVFYNINSAAAGINMVTEEETNETTNNEVVVGQIMKANLQQVQLVNPYGIAAGQDNSADTQGSIQPQGMDTPKNSIQISTTSEAAVNDFQPENQDTIWLLGNAMNGDEYDILMDQAAEKVLLDKKSKKDKKSDKNKKDEASAETMADEYIMTVSDQEIEMLQRIVEAEASGEDIIGKILVANVIFNRIEDEEFPNTIEEVIFQKSNGEYQFSPIKDKRYWSVKISKETKKAVERALKGEDHSEGALYFIARKRTKSGNAKWFDSHLDWLFQHGGHEFYK